MSYKNPLRNGLRVDQHETYAGRRYKGKGYGDTLLFFVIGTVFLMIYTLTR